ncbi:hypothetical protein SANA_07920 [Gottschalkiaceae bacterium SANA]|nr:hypothetical protein SANA_07920 [Gottschalkiaceae bacterium SANA]
MKKNLILVLAAIMICLVTAPQIFGLETAPAVITESQPLEFEAYLNTMPEREIPACDMPVLEEQYNEIVEAEQADQYSEANKQLDDFCFKLATYPYTV